MKIYNPTGFSSSLTGSFSGSVKGTFEGSFTGESLNNISGAFDSVSASLASDRLKNTTDTLDGDLTVTGTITAQEFHTEYVSASIIYQSGSTKFGDSSDDTHTFVGNLQVGTTALSGSGDPRVTVGSKGNYYFTSGNGLGDFHVGDGTYGLSVGVALGGGGAGDVRVWPTGGTQRLMFATPAGDHRLTIQSNGNIGIGTSLPGAKLHLYVNSANDDTFHIFNGSVRTHLFGSESSNGVIYMRSSANSNTVRINASGDSYFTGGNVGIGVTSPSSRLHIKSSAAVPGLIVEGDSGNEQIVIKRYSNANEQLIFGFHSSDYARIQAVEQGVGYRPLALNQDGGNVGIGITSPGAKLDVDGNIIAGGGNNIISGTGLFTTSTIQLHNGDAAANNIDRMADIVLANNTSYTDGILGRIIAVNSSLGTSEKRNAQISFNNDGATNSGSIGFSTSNAGTYSSKMVIKADGNVGINELNPKARLHVSAPYPTYTDFGTVFYGGTTNNSSQNGIMLSSAGNALGGVLGSNLFIDGTTWSQTNTGRSTGWLQMTNTTVSGQTSTLSYRGYVKGSTSTIERFNIDGTGRVGISNNTPAGKLHVSLNNDSTANISDWSENEVVFARGNTSRSPGIGFGVHTSNGTATISSLTPAVSWNALDVRASSFRFLSSGGIDGFSQDTQGHATFAKNVNINGTLTSGVTTLNSTFQNAYTNDGLYNANAFPSKVLTPSGQQIIFGYWDNGAGGYFPRIGLRQDYDAVGSPSTTTAHTSLGLEQDGRLNFKVGASNGIEALTIKNDGNIGVGVNNPIAKLEVNGSFRNRGDIYNEHFINLTGNYTAGTYYDLFTVALGIPAGVYIIRVYMDNHGTGGGVYSMNFVTVPFWWDNTGTNNANWCDFPPIIGSGHAQNGAQGDLPKFRLQQTYSGGGGTKMQMDPGKTWTGLDGTSGRTVHLYFKKLGT